MKHWPLSINTTSTHDTKRGEDARARLNAATDFQEEWVALVRTWMVDNEGLKKNGMPDKNDEYFIYQSVMATHPGTDTDNYINRFKEYLQKALREAKTHSNWAESNTAYENAAMEFAEALINGENDFHKTFMPWLKKIADHGMVNSLSQMMLKFTCPGVPDTYQGTELWDLSLVDPDNRRPVDYQLRKELLASHTSFFERWEKREDGSIKLSLLHQLLQVRNDLSDVFSSGDYVPLVIDGEFKKNAMAFMRSYKGKNIIVAVPLHIGQISNDIMHTDWKDTKIILPPGFNTQWKDLIKGTVLTDFYINDVFKTFPLGMLIDQ